MFNTRPWLYYYSPLTNKLVNTYIQGFLDICGNIVLRNGGFSLPNGDVSMNGNIYVGKTSTFIGDASMNGNLQVGLDASFNRNVSIQGTTTVNNDIYQIDGNSNMNIASSLGTFPNYGTAATGPNLINIGNSNFDLVSNGLRDSIAIGSNIIKGPNPIGHSNIAIGKNIFSNLQIGSQNIGIGNTIATSLTIGYNNIFIGTNVASGVSSGGNIVAIGTNAGTNAGEECTFFGANTGSLSTSYTKSTAIGYGTTITKSNQIKFCQNVDSDQHSVCVPGNMRVDGLVTCSYFSPKELFFEARRNSSTSALAANTTILAPASGIQGTGMQIFSNFGSVVGTSSYFKAPVSGYYLFFVNIGMYNQQITKWVLNYYPGDSTSFTTIADFYVNWVNGSTAGKHNPTVSAFRLLNAGDSVKVVTTTAVTLTNSTGFAMRSSMSATLLATI
jgi:hypothetical protein